MANSSILLGIKVLVNAESGLLTGKSQLGEIREVSHINNDPTKPIVFFVCGEHINGGAGAYVTLQHMKFVENENIQK
jgi:hypothetical protein